MHARSCAPCAPAQAAARSFSRAHLSAALRRHAPLSPQIEEIERVIGCGQVEQLIEQAKGELIVIPEYASWKMWELPPASPDDDEFVVRYSLLPWNAIEGGARVGLRAAVRALPRRAGGGGAASARLCGNSVVRESSRRRSAPCFLSSCEPALHRCHLRPGHSWARPRAAVLRTAP